jgi:phycocyanobilin lyase beta subunit
VTDTLPLQPLIDAIEQADSPDRLIQAVQALAATHSPAAIPMLIHVLGFNNPGAAMVAVRGLVQMGEAAVLPLLNQLDEYNYGARAYAIRALSVLADVRALEVLLTAAATDFAPSVRRAAIKGLGNLRWEQLPATERDGAQQRVLQSLVQIHHDGDWSLRYAAITGLQALALSATIHGATVIRELQQMLSAEADLAVNARIQWAIATLSEVTPPPHVPVH